MKEVAAAYVRLAHDIERHNAGYIDGYYGPEEWKGSLGERRPLGELAREGQELAAAVAAMGEGERRTFLEVQVRAMETSIALLQGEKISYADEVRLLYDIEPERVPETCFEEAIAALEDLLPGTGDIAAREQAFRAQFEVPTERLPPLLEVIVSELARRTRQLFALPEGEAFEVQYVNNKPWSGYNWYLGGYRSRIDINTDLPKRLTNLPDLIAHEAYPGHHTEHAIKEQHLWHEQGRGEHAILLINAPECVVSEGIATRAREVVMDDDQLRDWLVDDLVPRAGLNGVNIDAMLAINTAKQALGGVSTNAAFLYHEDGASEEDVLAYLQRYALRKPKEARQSLNFIAHPNFRSYLFTYRVGGQLLDNLFKKGNPQAWFARLLHEPVTPGMIREWVRGD